MSKEEIETIVRRFRFENLDMATKEATHWLRDYLTNIGPVRRDTLLTEEKSPRQMKLGQMYLFGYSPKGKYDLPFYDTFPLIVVLERTSTHILGLNLHYLRYYNRAVFLNYLLEYTNINEWYESPSAFMRVSYEKMKSSSGIIGKFMRASIKRYNYNNFVTEAKYVKPIDWKIVPFLPIDRFAGATREDVFKWAANQ